MRPVTKILVSVVAVLLLAFAGAVVFRLAGGTTSLPIPPAGGIQQLVSTLKPARTLEEALRERTKECLPEAQAAFVEEARRINDSFEDSYLLSLSTARIALSTVVRDMQSLAREMAGLETDSCAKPVQDKLVAAYEKAIDGIMKFMFDSDANVSTDLITFDLRDANRDLELYALSPQWLVYSLDTDQLRDALQSGDPTAPELAYLKELNALDAHSRCLQIYPFTSYYMESRRAVGDHYFLGGLTWDMESPTPEPTEEADPCSDVPIVANPRPVTVEYRLESLNGKTSSVESVWIDLPDGERFYAASLKLPYARTVEFMTGHQARISASSRADDGGIACTILADGKTVADETVHSQYDFLNCSLVLE